MVKINIKIEGNQQKQKDASDSHVQYYHSWPCEVVDWFYFASEGVFRTFDFWFPTCKDKCNWKNCKDSRFKYRMPSKMTSQALRRHLSSSHPPYQFSIIWDCGGWQPCCNACLAASHKLILKVAKKKPRRLEKVCNSVLTEILAYFNNYTPRRHWSLQQTSSPGWV